MTKLMSDRLASTADEATIIPFPAQDSATRRSARRPDVATSGDAWIYRPCRSPLQRGLRARPWVLDFVPQEPERPDFLMGWSGSADTRKQIRLEFATLDAALAFAARRGWEVTVKGEAELRPVAPRPTWLSEPPVQPARDPDPDLLTLVAA
ncbi:NADH dehydrogenase ubiquinone Fe-S protein 4 [Arenibaculum pallidiluteum]|uniref:NADH dehydrogenase ubiquinone Fe-S protein 4 n=1 Tax=Arenibaculum pallidiluteum TaxID=2812559 RepID=UPI001A9673B4|nr:NADH dehydrogenase ubiquinone Fe-S protein 4 [Arenibaculum pallidiluteum]